MGANPQPGSKAGGRRANQTCKILTIVISIQWMIYCHFYIVVSLLSVLLSVHCLYMYLLCTCCIIMLCICACNYLPPLLQDSEVFSSVDASEYICDLWRNPDHLTKENLAKFENVSLMCDADHECRPNNPILLHVWYGTLAL